MVSRGYPEALAHLAQMATRSVHGLEGILKPLPNLMGRKGRLVGMIPAASTVSKLEVALGVNSHLRKYGDGMVPFNARGSRRETENNHKTVIKRERNGDIYTVFQPCNGVKTGTFY